jgi:hypothetical protein
MERRRSIYPLLYWVREREELRKRKERGEIPWTQDPILGKYRFCNVRRRDDRVSQWLIHNVLQYRHLGFTEWSFLQFTALCRWVNWPPMLKLLRDEGYWPARDLDLPAIGARIDRACATGDKAWTGAYMVRADGTAPKGKFVCEVVIGAGLEAVKQPLLLALRMKMLRPVWEALYSANNWGSFMAGQVVADWSYTPLLERAGDICHWAPVGPGSLRGYNRLLGLPLRSPAPSEAEWCETLVEWRQAVIDDLGYEYVSLTLMDVQNSLCETDKYLRVKNGEGRPRSIYKPETSY